MIGLKGKMVRNVEETLWEITRKSVVARMKTTKAVLRNDLPPTWSGYCSFLHLLGWRKG
jgi:hypothetical protein